MSEEPVMNQAVQKVSREPALLVGVVTSGLGLAVLFGVPLSNEQTGGIVVFLGAVMALVRYIVTPSVDVVAQKKPGERATAGPAAVAPTGTPVTVVPVGPPPDEQSLS